MNQASADPPALAHRPAAPLERSLSRAQFSFLRGLFQGLDERQLWDRYLPGDPPADPARIRLQATGWMEQLAALARRRGRPDLASCLRWPRRRAPRATGAATIDDFAAGFPPDMHSEAEILALWRDAEAPANDHAATRRRARHVERQLDALRWLEGLEYTLPIPTDRLDGWLAPRLADRLRAAGIGDFDALRQCIERLGRRWHRAVPRLGAAGAARIESWLHQHVRSLGAMPTSVRRHGPPAPATPSPMVPLERLRLPAELSGADGANRGDRSHCRLSAVDDLEAVRAWLAEHAANLHTGRAYRREAERLLLWSVYERGRALSDLDISDCTAYLTFLRDPPARCLAPRHVSRQSVGWRPLEAALSERSIDSAAAIARALFAWLVRYRYLAKNPWGDLVLGRSQPVQPAKAPSASAQSTTEARHERAPPASDWAALRLRALFELVCSTGLRSDDLAAARIGWLRMHTDTGQTPRIHLCMPAKGRWPDRHIELPMSAVTALRACGIEAIDGLDADAAAANRPIFGHRRDPGRALSAARLGVLLEEAFVMHEARYRGANQIHDQPYGGLSRAAQRTAGRLLDPRNRP